MNLEKLNISAHDLHQVAGLIYDTDKETFNFFWGNKKVAIEKIQKLVESDDNSISWDKIHVLIEDKQILGLLVSFQASETSKKRDFKAIIRNFHFIDILKWFTLIFIDDIFLADLNPDDYYIACLAVDKRFRGKGLGTSILKRGIEFASKLRLRRVVLDVDMNNEKALNLYQRMGFKIFDKKILSFAGWNKGTYNMEYLLTRVK